jgi:hypothetical protein
MMMDPELGDKAQMMIAEDNKSTAIVSPKAKTIFTIGPLNKLVIEWNKVAPLFGIKDKYPTFTTDAPVFPTEFTKLLLMVTKATSDAIEAGIDVASPDISTVVDDRGILILAANLASISKNRDFKDWLLSSEEESPVEQTTEPVDAEEVEASKPVSDEAFTQMVASKMPVKM